MSIDDSLRPRAISPAPDSTPGALLPEREFRPLDLADLDRVREKLARASRDGTQLGRLWNIFLRRVEANPDGLPWLLPFAAAMTGRADLLKLAARGIEQYLGHTETDALGIGVQFHFWCAAFPHARQAVFFRWLAAMGVWNEEQKDRLARQFLTFELVNFFFGLRAKPEPECVDNQAMSLALSCGLVGGSLLDWKPGAATARRIYAEGIGRLPIMIGGMPKHGYSGEGSTYMGHVVLPALPFLVSILEAAHGGDWFSKPLPPNGCSAFDIVRMVARTQTPGGMLYPWDDYGYTNPGRMALAFAVARTGDPFFFRQLLAATRRRQDMYCGWGWDEWVWTFVWWPEKEPSAERAVAWSSWHEPEVGATLISKDGSRLLFQMWDPSEPNFPLRTHMNPNSVILEAWGVPLLVDGSRKDTCKDFDYPETTMERSGMAFSTVKINFGHSTAASHNVLLIDDVDTHYIHHHGPQIRSSHFDPETETVETDITPSYADSWPDAIRVRRRSRLVDGTFWLIEDLAQFRDEHAVTARWHLRQRLVGDALAPGGLAIETPEGVRLDLLPIVGPNTVKTREIVGFPNYLDGRSVRADFRQKGRTCRWLWLFFPRLLRKLTGDLSADWSAWSGPAESDPGDAARHLKTIPATADLREFLPVAEKPGDVVWLRRTFTAPPDAAHWVRFPAVGTNVRAWVNGKAVEIPTAAEYGSQLVSHLPLVAVPGGEYEIVLSFLPPSRHAQGSKEEWDWQPMLGEFALEAASAQAGPIEASWANERVRVAADGRAWEFPHDLIEEG